MLAFLVISLRRKNDTELSVQPRYIEGLCLLIMCKEECYEAINGLSIKEKRQKNKDVIKDVDLALSVA